MAKEIQLEIVTPEKITFSENVESVTVPGSEGEIGVLPGHMPLVALMGAGELRYKIKGQMGAAPICWAAPGNFSSRLLVTF